MICQAFNLEKYFNETKVYFNFFDGLFLLEKENKQQKFDKLQIPSSSYRTQRLKDKTNKYYINILLEYFKYNDIENENIIEYEILLSRIYYCCYYKQKDKLIELSEVLNIKIDKHNIIKPLLILFRVLINTNLEYGEDYLNEICGSDLNYLKLFHNKNYFKDELEYLYLIILYYFDHLDEKDFKYIDNLSISYPKLSWLYYFSKASKAYLNHNNVTALVNYEYVLNEFKLTNNLQRYLISATNASYLYNILGQYHLSYNITSQVIEYVFSEINDERRIQSLLVHYLFSNLMLARYNEIINFIDIVIFDLSYLNEIAAIICVVAAFKLGKLKHVDKILNLEFNGINFEIVKEYIKCKDYKLLDKLKEYPYIKIMKENSIF